MTRFVLGRLFGAVLVLWVVWTLSFVCLRLAPGSPFDRDKRLSPAVEINLWRTYGISEDLKAQRGGRVVAVHAARDSLVYADAPVVTLDSGETIAAAASARCLGVLVSQGESVAPGQVVAAVVAPAWRQYFRTLRSYARLDFGVSMSTHRPVAESIARGLAISAELGLYSWLLALFLGMAAGLAAGSHAGSRLDRWILASSQLGSALSALVLGPLLVWVLGIWLGWADFGGFRTPAVKVLPVLTLGLVYAAPVARLLRGSLAESLRSDFVLSARAAGLSPLRILFRHALGPAMGPLIAWLGPATAALLTGSVVVERYFGIAGLSDFFVAGALNRDYPMVFGTVGVYTSLLILWNTFADVAHAALDPRIR